MLCISGMVRLIEREKTNKKNPTPKLWIWFNIGAGCSEQFWNLCPWGCSEPSWWQPWATCFQLQHLQLSLSVLLAGSACWHICRGSAVCATCVHVNVLSMTCCYHALVMYYALMTLSLVWSQMLGLVKFKRSLVQECRETDAVSQGIINTSIVLWIASMLYHSLNNQFLNCCKY